MKTNKQIKQMIASVSVANADFWYNRKIYVSSEVKEDVAKAFYDHHKILFSVVSIKANEEYYDH